MWAVFVRFRGRRFWAWKVVGIGGGGGGRRGCNGKEKTGGRERGLVGWSGVERDRAYGLWIGVYAESGSPYTYSCV